MSDINEESKGTGTLVALGVDAGLTRNGQPLLTMAFRANVDTETLMKVTELLEKGRVL